MAYIPEGDISLMPTHPPGPRSPGGASAVPWPQQDPSVVYLPLRGRHPGRKYCWGGAGGPEVCGSPFPTADKGLSG